MALPSQTARPIARRSYMHRRSSRSRLRWWMLVGAALPAALLAWWLLPLGGHDPADPADPADPDNAEIDDAVTMLDGMSGTSGRSTKPAPAREKTPAPTPVIVPKRENRAATPKSPAATTLAAAQPVRTPTQRKTSAPAALRGTPDGRRSTRGALRQVQRVRHGLDLIASGRLVEARRVLSAMLLAGTLDSTTAAAVRARLTEVNMRLVFSPETVEGDPFAFTYQIKPNDRLSRLPGKIGIQADWRFLQDINRIPDPKKIRAGQRLKMITGPFHAVVHKADYRLDLFLGDPPEQVYVRSFPVGLGEFNSTPEGRFIVRPDSKLENPEWRNPRTRELFLKDNPLNPIGEYWVGLMADESHLSGINGYGIHGTIDPESIGRQVSMGCIRMLPEDIRLVWAALMEDSSTVEIRR